MNLSPTNLPPASADVASVGSRTVRFTVLLGDEADAAEAWHQTACGLLAAQGVRTLVARTGREALGLIEDSALGKGQRIHLAVLDQRMRLMGGLQILRRLQQDLADLRQHAGFQRAAAMPPTILLADSTASATMHEALSVRVFSVLPKPIELNLLLDTLARALRRYYQNKWPEGDADV